MDTAGDIGPLSEECDGPEGEPPQSGRLVLETVEEAGVWPAAGVLRQITERAAAAMAAMPDLEEELGEGSAACVAFTDDGRVRDLNSRFRGQDKPTNVLSFPAGEASPVAGEPVFIGDVVLAAGVVASEAAERGIPVEHHIQHLIVHGVLHLLGFDHETDPEALEMEGLERRILATLDIDDPYPENE